jgi:hypothetical protein
MGKKLNLYFLKHSNGGEYFIFRQDLYGDNVFDFASEELMQFFSESSFNK